MLETTLIGGVLFGLASALHCSAMCGGIACGAMLLLGADTPFERYRQLAIMQVGRVLTYTAIGAIGAAIGGGIVAPKSGASFQIMQWAAAVTLMWMGLVMAGVMPRIEILDRGAMRISSLMTAMTRPLRGSRTAGPLALGVVWGFNACPMVYGAAFFASLTGSIGKGALFMAGFGLGTVPAVVAAASGLTLLRTMTFNRHVRVAAGTAIALAGFASVYVPWHKLSMFCLTQ